MPSRGFFIAIEGIDGAGKRTQIDRLREALTRRGHTCVTFSFPRYGSFFGLLAGQYLNGEFGALDFVDPHFSALLYAGDRLEAKPELETALATGKTVLADRYVASNLAHQAARVAPARREEFIKWLRQLEYGQYALPVEDVVIYLRLPAAEAQARVSAKPERDYTARDHDLHEANLAHLEATARVYDALAKAPNWITVDSVDPATGARRTPEEVHHAVLAALEPRLSSPGG
jgi:dTMP kinase